MKVSGSDCVLLWKYIVGTKIDFNRTINMCWCRDFSLISYKSINFCFCSFTRLLFCQSCKHNTWLKEWPITITITINKQNTWNSYLIVSSTWFCAIHIWLASKQKHKSFVCSFKCKELIKKNAVLWSSVWKSPNDLSVNLSDEQ